MTVLDIFWIFFMLSALQPVIRQRMLDAMRMRKIAQLERERNSASSCSCTVRRR